MKELTTAEALALAREVFAGDTALDREDVNDFLGYALWNETAWPFSHDRALLRQQLERYRDAPARVKP